jgi:predicted metal-dependent peptidase
MNSKLEKALGRIILVFPVLGYISSKWKIKEGEVPTMGTNYTQLLYNRDFLDSLTLEEVGGVVLHEIAHCLLMHPTELTRVEAEGKNAELWQIALEIVANATVIDLIRCAGNSGTLFKLPGQPYSPLKRDQDLVCGPLYFYDPIGHTHTATEIYHLLEKKLPRMQSETGCRNTEISKDSPDPVTGNRTGTEDRSGKRKEASRGSDDSAKSPLSGDVLPASRLESQEAAEVTIAVLQKLSSLTKGNLPLGLNRLLKKLTEGKVPWERILQSWVGGIISGCEDFRWERPNHRHPLARELIMPGPVDNQLDEIVVTVDTSGSITDTQLARFASEIRKLAQYVGEITVITTDAEVHEKVKVSSASDLLKKLKFKGGGGTDFRPVFEAVKNCLGMIFFTDGCATYPEKKPGYPVLWILTRNNSTPPFGKVAFILDE